MRVMALVAGRFDFCELVQINHHTVWVRLPDGHIIKRRNRMVIMPKGRV